MVVVNDTEFSFTSCLQLRPDYRAEGVMRWGKQIDQIEPDGTSDPLEKEMNLGPDPVRLDVMDARRTWRSSPMH